MIKYDEENNQLIIDINKLYPIDSYKIKKNEVETTCKIIELGLFDTSIMETFHNALSVSNHLIALDKEKKIKDEILKEKEED